MMPASPPVLHPAPAVPGRLRSPMLRLLREELARCAAHLPEHTQPHAFARDFDNYWPPKAPWLFDREPEEVVPLLLRGAMLGLEGDWHQFDLMPDGADLHLRVKRTGLGRVIVRTTDGSPRNSSYVRANDGAEITEYETGPALTIRPPAGVDARGPVIFAHNVHQVGGVSYRALVTMDEARARVAQRAAPWPEDAQDMADMMATAAAAERYLATLPARWPALQRCRQVIALACGDWRAAAMPVGEMVAEADRARQAAQAALDRIAGWSRPPKWLRQDLGTISAALAIDA